MLAALCPSFLLYYWRGWFTVFQRKTSFACSALWPLMGFSFSVIPSGSYHEKFLTSSSLLPTPVLPPNVAAKSLLILIDLRPFGGLLETELSRKAKPINTPSLFKCAYRCTCVYLCILFRCFLYIQIFINNLKKGCALYMFLPYVLSEMFRSYWF